MKPQATIQKLRHGIPLRWVALGDSLTYGWMVKKGYLDFLAQEITKTYPGAQLTFYNRGIPGDTAEGGLRRIGEHVLSMCPDIVSVQFALNDLFVGYTVGQFRANILKLIERIRQCSSCDILLVTSVALAHPDENDHAQAFYAALMDISQQEDIPCALVHKFWERALTSGRRWNELVQADGVHPTEEGYRLMAEAIMDVLNE
ncbi:MAG: GDSL-type esterase/lipase family protein [Desulfobacterota bacterium]|nr:GDSL-type esterase/lipase family protein [Thermodesulfobacteriota bacterium]